MSLDAPLRGRELQEAYLQFDWATNPGSRVTHAIDPASERNPAGVLPRDRARKALCGRPAWFDSTDCPRVHGPFDRRYNFRACSDCSDQIARSE